jgi:hypothetical protein
MAKTNNAGVEEPPVVEEAQPVVQAPPKYRLYCTCPTYVLNLEPEQRVPEINEKGQTVMRTVEKGNAIKFVTHRADITQAQWDLIRKRNQSDNPIPFWGLSTDVIDGLSLKKALRGNEKNSALGFLRQMKRRSGSADIDPAKQSGEFDMAQELACIDARGVYIAPPPEVDEEEKPAPKGKK